jgi:hypothetical protein
MARARHASGAQRLDREAPKQGSPSHSDVFLKLDRLISARVEEQRRQQAKAKERNRGPARFQADEHEQAAAEFSQNDKRQQPTVNPMGLDIVGDAGIARDLPGALDDKNLGQHRPGKRTERASPLDKEIEVGVKSARLNRRRDPSSRILRLRHRGSSAGPARAVFALARVGQVPTRARAPLSAPRPNPRNTHSPYRKASRPSTIALWEAHSCP